MTSRPSQTSDLTRGYISAVLSAAALSLTGPFISYLTVTYDMPALVLAFWRDVFVVLTLLAMIAVVRSLSLRVKTQHLPYLIGYGCVLAFFNAMWTLSVALNGAAVSTVLAYSSSAFTVVLGWWLLKERLDWVKVMAVVIIMGGCVLVADALTAATWQTNLLGIITGLLSGLSYAAYSLMGRTASQRGLNPWTTLLYTFSFAALVFLAINLLGGGVLFGSAARPADMMWLGDSVTGWGILLLLAAGPTVAGFGLYNISLGYLPASITNLIVTLEPVFTAVIAYVFLGERLNVVQIVGSVLILGGVVFLRVFGAEEESGQGEVAVSAGD